MHVLSPSECAAAEPRADLTLLHPSSSPGTPHHLHGQLLVPACLAYVPATPAQPAVVSPCLANVPAAPYTCTLTPTLPGCCAGGLVSPGKKKPSVRTPKPTGNVYCPPCCSDDVEDTDDEGGATCVDGTAAVKASQRKPVNTGVVVEEVRMNGIEAVQPEKLRGPFEWSPTPSPLRREYEEAKAGVEQCLRELRNPVLPLTKQQVHARGAWVPLLPNHVRCTH